MKERWEMQLMSLISELIRRNVFRVALLYIASGWLVLLVTNILIAGIGSGDWVYRFAFGLLIICFPLVLIFSYLYEITPHGLRKEHQVEREHSITIHTGRKINKAIVYVLGLALALEAGQRLLN